MSRAGEADGLWPSPAEEIEAVVSTPSRISSAFLPVSIIQRDPPGTLAKEGATMPMHYRDGCASC